MNAPASKSGTRAVRLRWRNCECCGGGDLEQLWHQTFTARTRSDSFSFDVNNVICRNCGFVFVSPVFDAQDLADYYAASFSAFDGAAPDYDSEKRLTFLKEVAPRGDLFVEVGANRPTEFHQRLREIYRKVETVEINDSVCSDHTSLAAMLDGSVDVLAHYFVLEHIPEVRSFLNECSRVLRDGGVMVCEVPDIDIYPDDPVALLLYEHTNHFSQCVLREIASRSGFELLEIDSEMCSRHFGFAAAFRKSALENRRYDLSEYRKNSEAFSKGVEKLDRLRSVMDAAFERLEAYRDCNVSVILWGANDLMSRFLDKYPSLHRVTLVDSNPRKVDFFSGIPVLTPSAAEAQIKGAAAIFIFTRRHADSILDQVELSTGKKFETDHVHVVDPYGDALPRH